MFVAQRHHIEMTRASKLPRDLALCPHVLPRLEEDTRRLVRMHFVLSFFFALPLRDCTEASSRSLQAHLALRRRTCRRKGGPE